jgi:G3E family GTPase
MVKPHTRMRRGPCLRLALLINEVGALDVDSQLADVTLVHASSGLPPMHAMLAGGCVCCAAADDLEASLATLASWRGAAVHEGKSFAIDYLVRT